MTTDLARPTEVLGVDVDGTVLHTLRSGPAGPGARTVVLLHGWPETSHAWRHVMPRLAVDHQVLAVDLPGLGESGAAPAGAGVRPAADLLEAWRRELGLGPVDLVGHDLGAPTAYAWAAAHRDAVRTLTVVDAPLAGPGLEAFVRDAGLWHFGFFGVPGLAETLGAGREDALLRPFLTPPLRAGALTEDDVARYVRAYARPGALEISFGYYRAYPADAEVFAANAPLELPVLAIGAGRGAAWHIFRSYSAVAPGATGRVIADSGHYVPEERPAELASRVSTFLTTTSRR